MKHNEKVFQEQLNEFEQAIEDDLNQRAANFSCRWDVDLQTKQPMKSTLNKTMSWESVSAVDRQTDCNQNQRISDEFKTQIEIKPRAIRQISKPKMNIGNRLVEKDLFSTFSGSYGGQQRASLFADSQNRKSTDGDSMFGSMVESIGKMSIVDHFSHSFEYRTSLVRNMHQKKKPNDAREEARERDEAQELGRGASADSSLNDRCSSTIEDGPPNEEIVIKYLAITASKSRSENRNSDGGGGPKEEFKASDGDDDANQDAKMKQNFLINFQSGSGRLLPGIKSFIQDSNDSSDPFANSQDSSSSMKAPPTTAMPADQVVSETMNSARPLNDIDDEDCNAEDDADEYSTQKIPVGPNTSTVASKKVSPRAAAFGPAGFQ